MTSLRGGNGKGSESNATSYEKELTKPGNKFVFFGWLRRPQKKTHHAFLPDNTKVIKVSSSPISSKGFFKSENDAGHTVPIPDRAENSVPKPGGNRENNAVLLQKN